MLAVTLTSYCDVHIISINVLLLMFVPLCLMFDVIFLVSAGVFQTSCITAINCVTSCECRLDFQRRLVIIIIIIIIIIKRLTLR